MLAQGKRKKAVDVAIIGGGIVGTSVARELSKYQLNLILLEKEAEVGWGTTKANSGIVHAGFHEVPGTLKHKYCFAGNKMFPRLCEELDVSFRQNGILVAARNEEEMSIIQSYYENGKSQGINVQVLSRDEALALEPNLTPALTGALLASDGGSVMPFELAAALMENAVENGAQLMLESPVINAAVCDGFKYIETPTHVIRAAFVINAAGVYSDEIARLFGDDYFTIQPRKGEEYLFDLSYKNIVSRTIFPIPTKVSKGILVIPTSEGNLMIGPTSDDCGSKEDLDTSADGFKRILEGARSLVPCLDPTKIIAQFAGVRATSDRGDFIVEFSPNVPGLLHLAGMESPGLTAAPAIAAQVPGMLEEAGCELIPQVNFNPYRKDVIRFRQLPRKKQALLVEKKPAYGKVICRCETITEGEIVDAIRRGARTLDGIKFRVRAGAGRCQGGFCEPLIADILSRELGIPVTQVTKRGKGSELVHYKSKELLTKGGTSRETV
ncbi:MAG TPA: NAD(P)/FAD-dependent oxidoreductase [Firmicutes bacterium]|nr:NAD(P)/FAD-dependent oxidoreductase [Bacillota bacterium]